MGSINDMDFLDDPTGSRRFLSFVVKSIDYKASININQVWAEAYRLYLDGFKYWFDGKEIEELNDHNRQFQHQTIEEELLLKHFRPAIKNEIGSEFLTTSEILNSILQDTNIKNITPGKIGRALTKHNFIKWQKGADRISGYSVLLK
jgi:predicted P-loop ATPase